MEEQPLVLSETDPSTQKAFKRHSFLLANLDVLRITQAKPLPVKAVVRQLNKPSKHRLDKQGSLRGFFVDRRHSRKSLMKRSFTKRGLLIMWIQRLQVVRFPQELQTPEESGSNPIRYPSFTRKKYSQSNPLQPGSLTGVDHTGMELDSQNLLTVPSILSFE